MTTNHREPWTIAQLFGGPHDGDLVTVNCDPSGRPVNHVIHFAGQIFLRLQERAFDRNGRPAFTHTITKP